MSKVMSIFLSVIGFFLGLAIIAPLWSLLPQIAEGAAYPKAVYGVYIFIYTILAVYSANWIYSVTKQCKKELY